MNRLPDRRGMPARWQKAADRYFESQSFFSESASTEGASAFGAYILTRQRIQAGEISRPHSQAHLHPRTGFYLGSNFARASSRFRRSTTKVLLSP